MNTDTEQPTISQPEFTQEIMPVFPTEPLQQKSNFKKLPLIIGIGAIILIVIVSSYYMKKHRTKKIPVAMKSVSAKPTSMINLTPAIASTLSAVPKTSVDMETTRWKTYENATYSIQYPANWFIYEYPNSSFSTDESFVINISEVTDPNDIAKYFGHKNHQIFQAAFFSDKMPANFPYTNGDSSPRNPTIKSIVINGYSGIRGNETIEGATGAWDKKETITSLADVIYLTNPKGGYIDIENLQGSTDLFNTILTTFKFK